MDGHLVADEIGIEALAYQRVDADGIAFDEHRLEGLDTHAVQGRSAVEEDRMVLDNFLENVPNLLGLALQHFLGRFNRVGVAQLLEPANNERLKELQGDLLGQTALVQPQFRTDYDYRTSGIINALAQQVFAESALLALDHVGERFQGAVAGAQDGPLAAVVVEQSVDRLLQHPLFVADDDFRGVEVDQFLESVVAVDDAA